MDKNGFNQIMDHPGTVSADQWEALHREREKHPFCAPLQLLSLLVDKANGAPLWEKQTLPQVSLYMQDASTLYSQLAHLSKAQPAAPPVEPMPQAPIDSTPDGHDFDILQEINSYQEVSFKTAPKSVILTNFLEKDGGIDLSDADFEDTPVPELAKKSIRPSDSLETETLALILEKQGKLSQAIDMYEKLIINNPEKSSNFAGRIALLQSQLEKQNN